MAQIEDKDNVRDNRLSIGDDSMPISTRLLNDLQDSYELVEKLIRSEKQVEATVDTILNSTTFSTDTVTFGGYDKVIVGHTVLILDGDAKDKRFRLDAIGTGATPDITINANPSSEGIASGDKYRIIYGVPADTLGHKHGGLDSELLSNLPIAVQLMFGDIYSGVS